MNNNKFNKAKIYMIKDNTTENVYIGSTCKKLSQRLVEHKAHYKRYLDGKTHYTTSFKILENGDYTIILLEELKHCENKMEMHARERHYIETVECVTKCVPGRTKKEYYTQNKDEINEKRNISLTCPHCQCDYTRSNKSHHEKTKKHINNIKII